MRILRVRCRYINNSDRQLAGLIHETAELRRLIHVAGARLCHTITILGHEIRIYRYVGTDSAGGALHLWTGTSRIESLTIQALAWIRLSQRRHICVRR